METQRLSSLVPLVAVVLSLASSCQRGERLATREWPPVERVDAAELASGSRVLRVSGPYRHDNLDVFLIHGASTTDADFITLEEGLASGEVVLTERAGGEGNVAQAVNDAFAQNDANEPVEPVQTDAPGNRQSSVQFQTISSNFVDLGGATVDTLEIENKSDRPLYVQAGDIVKGGRQDRTIGVDIVIGPKSGKVPVEAFCVESGRWQNRATNLAVDRFEASNYALNTKALKLAVRDSADQSGVWNAVKNAQVDIQTNTGVDVSRSASPTSYQLSLENEDFAERTKAYTDALAPFVAEHDDVVGLAFAVNGTLNSVDVYASSKLFRKLSDKLLHACATEAIAELDGEVAAQACATADVSARLAEGRHGKAETREVSEDVANVSVRSDAGILFETRVKEQTIRENFLTK